MRIAQGFERGQGVAHCSGAASLEPLESAAEQGAVIGALHPLQAFSSVDEGVQNIPGVTFGIESARRYATTLSAWRETSEATRYSCGRRTRCCIICRAC